MAISKDKKRNIIAKMDGVLKGATALIFVNFSKFTVADSSRVRRELKKSGVGYCVVKKTLLRKALEGQSIAGEMPNLPGETAVAWTSGTDITAPARIISEESRKLKGALTLLGGILERSFADAQRVNEIALVPPLPVLRRMFVNVINSPIQGLVVALGKISKQKSVI